MRDATLIRCAVVAVLAGTLAACATQPPPSAADVRADALAGTEVRQAWAAGDRPAAGATSAEIGDNWLATFSDPVLSSLVAEAIARNPDLRAAGARVEQAAAYATSARAALLPWVNLLGTGGVKAGGGSDLTSALQGIMLGVSWEPDLWGRLRYGRDAAAETYYSAQSDYEFARQSLAAQVARSWFTAIETKLQLDAAQAMEASGAQLLALAEDRQRVGNGSAKDVALARASLGTLRDSARQARLAHVQAVRSLETLVGRYPSAELEVATDLPVMPGAIPVGMPLDMLERRPDLLAAERRVNAAFDRVGEARASLLPTIRLNASISALSSDVLQLQDDYENPSGGAGGTLFAPLYRGGALRAQVELRTAEQKEAVALYGGQLIRALRDVENALAASAILSERVTILRDVAADQEKALDLEQQSYRVGRSDLRAVQLQQQQVESARVAYVRARSEELSQRVNLHLALGGSFAEPVALAGTQAAR
jgi:NodT family efflux transporter outer membrane factor (OMF) lipoprotein